MRYLYAALGTAALVMVGTFWWMTGNVNRAVADDLPSVAFTVGAGQKLRQVALALERQRLIPSASAWALYAILQSQRSNILAGQYSLNPSMTGREILRTVTSGDKQSKEVTVKIREGLTAEATAEILEGAGVVTRSDFLTAARVTDSRTVWPDKTYGFLADKPTVATLEGFLFPDTYRFFKDSSAAVTVQKLLDNFDRRIGSSLRQTAARQRRTLYEEIIMASILEAELKTDADRAMAADIFWRRLDAGIALQSDATVNYVTGKGRLQPSIADTEVDSPYNTYRHRGLPPGPINNPGLSAIRAAINPTANDYWFYLTAKDGKTIFSKTLDEHNRNKAEYLR